jgi:WD repeat-containing protein 1 (actin-interacting protein 1)
LCAQDGTLNLWDPSKADAAAPVSRVRGHAAPVTSIAYDLKTGSIVSADVGGRVVVSRPRDEGRTVYDSAVVEGDLPTKKATGVAVAGGEMAVISWDDKLRIGDAVTGAIRATLPLPGQPKGVAVSEARPTQRVVVTGAAVLVFNAGALAATVDAPWAPTCVDVTADGSLVGVGGKDKKIHFFHAAADGSLTADGETKECTGELSVVGFSPDGSLVAGGDAVREVRLYSTAAGKETLKSSRWMNHTTRVTGLKFSPDGRFIATVSTDRRLCVWDPATDAPKLSVDLANPVPFAGVVWADPTTIWTLGVDGVATRRVLTL